MYADTIGRTETRPDRVRPSLPRALPRDPVAAFDRPVPEPAPPLRHRMPFQDRRPPRDLGPDGHLRHGDSSSPVHDLPRRGEAGACVRRHGEGTRCVGEAAMRADTIADVSARAGASGRLARVIVRRGSPGSIGPATADGQDPVCRGTDGTAVKDSSLVLPAPGYASHAEGMPGSGPPFRSCASPGNGRRIHDDPDDATRRIGDPGPVVHGPRPIPLTPPAARHRPGRRIASFECRGRRLAAAGRPVVSGGWDEGAAPRPPDADGARRMDAGAHLG